MKPCHILICGLCAASAFTATAEWHVKHFADPMTDAMTYTIGTPGDFIPRDDIAPLPSLLIQLEPKYFDPNSAAITGKQDLIFTIEPYAIKRTGTPVKIRFDKNTPITVDGEPSTDRNSVFLPPSLLPKIRNSSQTTIQLTSSLGKILTIRFPTGGLSNALAQVRSHIKTTRPASIKFQPARTNPKP